MLLISARIVLSSFATGSLSAFTVFSTAMVAPHLFQLCQLIWCQNGHCLMHCLCAQNCQFCFGCREIQGSSANRLCIKISGCLCGVQSLFFRPQLLSQGFGSSLLCFKDGFHLCLLIVGQI